MCVCVSVCLCVCVCLCLCVCVCAVYLRAASRASSSSSSDCAVLVAVLVEVLDATEVDGTELIFQKKKNGTERERGERECVCLCVCVCVCLCVCASLCLSVCLSVSLSLSLSVSPSLSLSLSRLAFSPLLLRFCDAHLAGHIKADLGQDLVHEPVRLILDAVLVKCSIQRVFHCVQTAEGFLE